LTTRLLLVRHGATTLSAEDRFAGSTDVALSDEGRHQAARLGVRLADDAITAVYCSPMGRTMDTASIIAEAHR
jgi:broad specificity phosphatase PhoE